MEQTFHDLYHEHHQQPRRNLFGFVAWTFVETALGIVRERLQLISPGDIMQAILKPLGSSAFLSLLLILPFMLMEVVNRRNLNEDFPFVLFFVLWLNLFAVLLILSPIVRSRWVGKQNTANSTAALGNTLVTNPRSAVMTSGVLILIIVILSLLVSLGQVPREGSNTEYIHVFGVQVPSQVIAFALLSLPIAAGVIASGTIARTLRAGGSLFAHPVHLIIVVVISFLFAAGVVGLIMDQWPCFIGVPNCD